MCHEEPAGTPDPLWTPNIHRLNVELELDRISTSYREKVNYEKYEQVDLTGLVGSVGESVVY